MSPLNRKQVGRCAQLPEAWGQGRKPRPFAGPAAGCPQLGPQPGGHSGKGSSRILPSGCNQRPPGRVGGYVRLWSAQEAPGKQLPSGWGGRWRKVWGAAGPRLACAWPGKRRTVADGRQAGCSRPGPLPLLTPFTHPFSSLLSSKAPPRGSFPFIPPQTHCFSLVKSHPTWLGALLGGTVSVHHCTSCTHVYSRCSINEVQ